MPGQAPAKPGHTGILYSSLTATVRRLELGGVVRGRGTGSAGGAGLPGRNKEAWAVAGAPVGQEGPPLESRKGTLCYGVGTLRLLDPALPHPGALSQTINIGPSKCGFQMNDRGRVAVSHPGGPQNLGSPSVTWEPCCCRSPHGQVASDSSSRSKHVLALRSFHKQGPWVMEARRPVFQAKGDEGLG